MAAANSDPESALFERRLAGATDSLGEARRGPPRPPSMISEGAT
jgi:hypothetical protein